MCNCINSVLKNTKDLLLEKHKPAKIPKVEWENTGIVFLNKTITTIVIPIEYEIHAMNAKGEPMRPKRRTTNIIPSFCPFCGQKQKSMNTKKG